MARLPRLTIPHQPHHVIQRGHSGQSFMLDDDDRRRYLAMLREAAVEHGVAVHAYVLLDDHVHLLATPVDQFGLSRTVQSLGRRYAAAFNRRHGRSGTIWDGRFRAGVIESERYFLSCMRLIEAKPVLVGRVVKPTDWPWSSARHHLGLARDSLVADHRCYWALGNTPFERELAYRDWMAQGVAAAEAAALTDAASKGWVLGSAPFLQGLKSVATRPLQPRRRGRPKRDDK